MDMKQLGGCIVSKNILEKQGRLKYCVKEESVNQIDNGWRFLSDIDNQEFLSDPGSMVVAGFDAVVAIEPMVMNIFNQPVGSDFALIYKGDEKYFIDTITGKRLED